LWIAIRPCACLAKDAICLARLAAILYNPGMATPTQAPLRSRSPNIESVYVSTVGGGILLAAIGWTGLVWLIFNSLPTVPNRWLFFLLLQIALSGTALPFVRYLHQRFARKEVPPVGYIVMVRQSIWVGLFGVVCLWLRIPRLLSIPLAVIVLAALVMVEFLLRLRERTQWQPE
jgi:hypothetical protein